MSGAGPAAPGRVGRQAGCLERPVLGHDGGVPSLYLRLRGAVAAVGAPGPWVARRQEQRPGRARLESLPRPRCSRSAANNATCTGGGASAPVPRPAEPPLVKWHGGQRWVRAEPSAASRRERSGHATLFASPRRRSPGQTPLPRRSHITAGPVHRELKHQFDPKGIFRPAPHVPRLLKLARSDQPQRRIQEHAGRPGGGGHPPQIRALRFLHRDLPDLPDPGQQTRRPAGTHLPDQGGAGARPRQGAQLHLDHCLTCRD